MNKLPTKTSGCGVNTLVVFSHSMNTMKKTISVYLSPHDGATVRIDAQVGKSLMQAATAANVDGIAADCGGSMTCATCHVYVDEPFIALLEPPDAGELAMLAFTAVSHQPSSRLSCQITLSDALDGMTVTLPSTQY